MNLGDYAKSQGQLDVAKDHQMKGLEAARVSGDPRLIGLLLLDQALLAEKKGDYNKALSLFREAAITGSEGMDDFLLPFVLMDYAKLAYQLKTTLQPENIVRLIAVAEVIGARWKTLHEASPEWDFTQLKDELHAELGSTAWNALWEEGALLSQDQALEMILDDH